ncbi:MAG: family 16 glycoside hydrolase [Planctomycetaceae bacterium]
MKLTLLTALLCSLLASAASAGDGWVTLFDGQDLKGWKVNENPETWKVADGALTCHGDRSHIFYVGPEAPFHDFELELEVMTRDNSNAGVYICTKYQDTGWPKVGFECQVNNSYVKDPRKTGSLYAVKDVNESAAKDDEWWTYNIRLVGKTITIKVNGKVVNEYTEPADAQPGKDFDHVIAPGTIALQGHDPRSTVSFRNIRVKKLGSAAAVPAEVSVGDAAPKFVVKDDQGKNWNAAEHFAKGTTVVYFYPADFTGGCTKQACSYRDDFSKLQDLGVNVVGVSGDSVATHQLFKKHHKLNFTLLSDPEGQVAAAFGVPTKLGSATAKGFDLNGQEIPVVRTATISRWTYVIKDGRVVAVDSKVNAAADSEKSPEVVTAVKSFAGRGRRAERASPRSCALLPRQCYGYCSVERSGPAR